MAAEDRWNGLMTSLMDKLETNRRAYKKLVVQAELHTKSTLSNQKKYVEAGPLGGACAHPVR